MKATKNWPESASFLVDWLEKNNLIEEVEEIADIHKANDEPGLSNLFDFSLEESPDYWFEVAVNYKRVYDSAKLSGGYKDFYKLRNKD